MNKRDIVKQQSDFILYTSNEGKVMVYMIERGHSDRFWSMVSRVIPDYEEYARWLNENGADLDL